MILLTDWKSMKRAKYLHKTMEGRRTNDSGGGRLENKFK